LFSAQKATNAVIPFTKFQSLIEYGDSDKSVAVLSHAPAHVAIQAKKSGAYLMFRFFF
jgi:hypothetical protein